ncbi:MAG: hypothetical protein U1F54_16275 [Burkholderiales bacterium]
MGFTRVLLAALAAFFIALPATASNVTDHWYAPAESGWGVSVTHQGNVAFIVLFAYGQDGQPAWYAGDATRYGECMGGHPGFAGTLYRMKGPWLGGPFDPAKVDVTPVGTVTFESYEHDRATLAYSIDGVSQSKTVQRLTFRYKNWSGLYRGVARANYRECAPTFTPAFTYDDGLIDVEHEGTSFRLWFDGKKAACMFTGTYAQKGRIGSAAGSYVCGDGPSGTFAIDGIESTERTLGGRLEMTHPSCSAMSLDLAGFTLQATE